MHSFVTIRISRLTEQKFSWIQFRSRSRENINHVPIVSLRVEIPADLAEQTAIATVLSDMDAELAALEARRDKTRALKQGMMQELLTGRIRLV